MFGALFDYDELGWIHSCSCPFDGGFTKKQSPISMWPLPHPSTSFVTCSFE